MENQFDTAEYFDPNKFDNFGGKSRQRNVLIVILTINTIEKWKKKPLNLKIKGLNKRKK